MHNAYIFSHEFCSHSGFHYARKLASGGLDNKIRLWTLQTGEQMITLVGHINPVNAITFSPDGKLLVSGSSDKTVRIWQLPPT